MSGANPSKNTKLPLYTGIAIFVIVLLAVVAAYTYLLKSPLAPNNVSTSSSSNASYISIPAGYSIYDFAVNPLANELYAVGTNSTSLTGHVSVMEFNLTTNKAGLAIPVDFLPGGSIPLAPRSRVAVDDATGTIYALVVNYSAGDVPNDVIYVINASVFKISHAILPGPTADVVAISAEQGANRVYAETDRNGYNNSPGVVYSYVSQNGSIALKQDALSGNFLPYSIDSNSKLSRIYVSGAGFWSYGKYANSNLQNYTVITMNASTGSILNVASLHLQTTNRLEELHVDSANDKVYVFNRGALVAVNNVTGYGISEIDGITGNVLANFTLPQGVLPTTMEVNPAGNKIYIAYVTSTAIGLYTINATTGVLLNTTPLNLNIDPTEMKYDVANGKLYIYSENAGSGSYGIAVINAP